MRKFTKCYFNYSQLMFTMEFLISYCLNVLPTFNLQRIGVVVSLALFVVHALFSAHHNQSTMESEKI